MSHGICVWRDYLSQTTCAGNRPLLRVRAIIIAVRYIYLLTCPRTREQYVGMASGAGGFLARWREYWSTGHGGNVGLKSRDPSDYQVSILETVGNSATEADLLALEVRWKNKLQSREMGLNRN